MKMQKGGEFLINNIDSNEIFIPENKKEEEILMIETCYDFIKKEIIPYLDKFDKMEDNIMLKTLEKASELGLLGISIDEKYDGMNMNFTTSLFVTEALGASHSFSVAYGAHTGIGTLPLYYYGNENQKNKYLKKLINGEFFASYCLTEPSSGSDANSGKSSARLSDDGNYYILNGQKMWITNAGFAKLHTVFAKIDNDEKLSAFLVEANWEGVQLNAEEKKMGIKGSSTRQVFYNEVKVPIENMLSERQNGFKIALNILNIGRIKLAAGVIGAGKYSITEAIMYANDREQFGRIISKYGAIRKKIAQSCIKIFAVESALYRVGNNIDRTIEENINEGIEQHTAILKGLEEFASECAILKVAGSECLDFIVDEYVQILGGMGYSAEMNAERAYRDSRINRIFEGTNEINRMLIVDIILKKALKGKLDLLTPAQSVAKELTSIPTFENKVGLFAQELNYIMNFKKIILMVAGSAVQKLSETLSKEQEILMNISDIIIDTYLSESAILRVKNLVENNIIDENDEKVIMAKSFIYNCNFNILQNASDAINSFAKGDELKMMNMGLKRFLKHEAFDIKSAYQKIAIKCIESNKYAY